MGTLIEHYGGEMDNGDVFIMNDPFDGGMHLPDVFVIKPVFLGEQLIGCGATIAHQGDIGGRLLSSSATDNTEIFHDGLRIPWMRPYRRGEPVEEVHELIVTCHSATSGPRLLRARSESVPSRIWRDAMDRPAWPIS